MNKLPEMALKYQSLGFLADRWKARHSGLDPIENHRDSESILLTWIFATTGMLITILIGLLVREKHPLGAMIGTILLIGAEAIYAQVTTKKRTSSFKFEVWKRFAASLEHIGPVADRALFDEGHAAGFPNQILWEAIRLHLIGYPLTFLKWEQDDHRNFDHEQAERLLFLEVHRAALSFGMAEAKPDFYIRAARELLEEERKAKETFSGAGGSGAVATG